MHDRQRPPSHPSGLAVHSPIFPGEYSQFCPSLVHVPAGFCGEPSLELLAAGQPARQAIRSANPAVVFITQTIHRAASEPPSLCETLDCALHGQSMGAVDGIHWGSADPVADISVPGWAVWPAVVVESAAVIPIVSSNFQ